MMQLKVMPVQNLPAINFNYEELKEELSSRLKDYENVQYTEEQEKELKADLAKLNKLAKVLNDERIRLKKEYSIPIEEFEAKMKDLDSMIKEVSGKLKKQKEEFELKWKESRKAAIEKIFEEGKESGISLEQIWNEKLLNKTMTDAKVKEYFKSCHDKYNQEIEILINIPEYGDIAIEYYKKTLSLAGAQKKAIECKEIAERALARKAEEERRRKEEQERKEAEARKEAERIQYQKPEVISEPPKTTQVESDPEQPERRWSFFGMYLTREQAVFLSNWCKENEIPIKRAKEA